MEADLLGVTNTNGSKPKNVNEGPHGNTPSLPPPPMSPSSMHMQANPRDTLVTSSPTKLSPPPTSSSSMHANLRTTAAEVIAKDELRAKQVCMYEAYTNILTVEASTMIGMINDRERVGVVADSPGNMGEFGSPGGSSGSTSSITGEQVSAAGRRLIRSASPGKEESPGRPESLPDQHLARRSISSGSCEGKEKINAASARSSEVLSSSSKTRPRLLNAATLAALRSQEAAAAAAKEKALPVGPQEAVEDNARSFDTGVKPSGSGSGSEPDDLNNEVRKFQAVMRNVGAPGDSAEQLEAFLTVLIRGVTEMEAEQDEQKRREKASAKELQKCRQKLEEAEDTVCELRVKLRHENADTRAATAERKLQEFLIASEQGRNCKLADKVADMTRERKEERRKLEEKLEEKDDVIETLQELLRKHKDFMRKEELQSKNSKKSTKDETMKKSINLMDDY